MIHYITIKMAMIWFEFLLAVMVNRSFSPLVAKRSSHLPAYWSGTSQVYGLVLSTAFSDTVASVNFCIHYNI